MNPISTFLHFVVRKNVSHLSNDFSMIDKSSSIDFEVALKEHYTFITKVCVGFADSEDELKDLVQEVCYRIWKNFPSFKGKAKLSTWIYRVTINVCLYEQGIKSKSTTEYVNQELLEQIGNHDEIASPENHFKNKLYAALKRLKPEDRALIMLYLEKNTYDQIAEILGLTSSNIGVRINRIKKKLKKIITND